MREQRLLERIASLETGNNHPMVPQSSAQLVMESIRAHLQRLFNTRQGSVPIDLEFGVPDFTNLAGSFSVGSTSEIVQALTRMIERYEPRLKQPKISISESENEVLSLNFQLEAYVQLGQHGALGVKHAEHGVTVLWPYQDRAQTKAFLQAVRGL